MAGPDLALGRAVHTHLAAARIVGPGDGDLDPDAGPSVDHQRRLDDEFFHHARTGFVAHTDDQVDQGRAGQHRRTGHPVVVEPGTGGRGDQAGGENPAGAGQRDHGAHQGWLPSSSPTAFMLPAPGTSACQ